MSKVNFDKDALGKGVESVFGFFDVPKADKESIDSFISYQLEKNNLSEDLFFLNFPNEESYAVCFLKEIINYVLSFDLESSTKIKKEESEFFVNYNSSELELLFNCIFSSLHQGRKPSKSFNFSLL